MKSPLKMRLLFLVAAALVVALGGVAVPARAQDTRLVFADDFTHNYSGWKLAVSDFSQMSVGSGKLRLKITKEGRAGWVFPVSTSVPNNVDVEVTASVVDPDASGDWNLALLLRADTADSAGAFYHFGVNGASRWEVKRRQKNPETYAENIENGSLFGFNVNQPITLRVSARENTFVFFVNGSEVATIEDDLLLTDLTRETYIGLMAGTYTGAPSQTVDFSGLRVYEPVVQPPLLSENFLDANPNDWILGTTDESTATIISGTMSFQIKKSNIIRWSYPRKATFPADVDVTATFAPNTTAAETGWGAGLGVRGYKDGDNLFFYLMEVRGTGEFTFTYQKGGNVEQTLISATAIPGFFNGTLATMRIVARGDLFELYYNDKKVGSVRDSRLSSAASFYTLLTAGTFESMSKFDVFFTGLEVRAP